jgi:hypothetical protein
LLHIAALVLLVSFPITAIDLNFSIFQCKHKGIFHILLFGKPFQGDCCGKNSNNDPTNESKLRTCCNNQNQFDYNLDDIEPKISLSNELIDPEHSDIEEHRSEDCSHQKQDGVLSNNISQILICSSCCYQTQVKLSLPNTIVPTENSKKIIFSFGKQINNHSQCSLDIVNSNKSNHKTVNYPIKELTFHIISYILYSSSKKDKEDVPLFSLC